MSRIEPYLDHIEEICGDNAEYHTITEEGETPPVTVISFADVPEPGSMIAFSFGLSSIDHPEWTDRRPELVISVDSLDISWALAMGEMIRSGRHKNRFRRGTMLNFGEPVSDESPMSCFLVYACTALEEEDQRVDLPDRKLGFSQLYPIHESEVEVIRKIGIEKFIRGVGENLFNVKRPPHRGS